MGLFDRFKRKDVTVKEKDDVDKLVKKADNLVEQIHETEQRNNDTSNLVKERVDLVNKVIYYKSIKLRLLIIKKLYVEHKIKLSPEAIEDINKWLNLYQNQKVDEGYYAYLQEDNYNDISNISLPSFPVTADDIFYPKENPFVLDILESLLDYENMYDNVASRFDAVSVLFREIKPDAELISVADAKGANQK